MFQHLSPKTAHSRRCWHILHRSSQHSKGWAEIRCLGPSFLFQAIRRGRHRQAVLMATLSSRPYTLLQNLVKQQVSPTSKRKSPASVLKVYLNYPGARVVCKTPPSILAKSLTSSPQIPKILFSWYPLPPELPALPTVITNEAMCTHFTTSTHHHTRKVQVWTSIQTLENA